MYLIHTRDGQFIAQQAQDIKHVEFQNEQMCTILFQQQVLPATYNQISANVKQHNHIAFPTLLFVCLFWFNTAFNNFSVVSRWCLVATVSSVLTFTVLSH